MRPPVLPLLACLLSLSPGCHSQSVSPALGTGAMPAPILVELFTSEGCSDCPPADALLRQISGTRTAARQQILVLSEHVTYWDHLGWKDNFSDAAFTARQNGYSEKLNLDSVYTPQMVVNGSRQFVGNNVKALRDALNAEVPREGIDLHILSVDRAANTLNVHFSAGHLSGSAPLDVIAAITDDMDESHVSRGENGGHTLSHVAVARSLTRVAEIRGDTEQTLHIAWPASLKDAAAAPRHLLLFVQEHNYGRIVGAVTRPLTSQEIATN